MRSSYETKLAFISRIQKALNLKILTSYIIILICTILSIFILINVMRVRALKVSELIWYLGIIFTIQNSVAKIINMVSIGFKNFIYLDKLLQFLKMPNSKTYGTKKVNKSKSHIIEFNNVSFRYNNGLDVLQQINFKISTEQLVSIIGENGSGKTTLTKLLLRIYTPTEGFITLDGININEYDESYNDLFSIIFQDFARYHVELCNSIAFGRKIDWSSNIIETLIGTMAKKIRNSFLSTTLSANGINLSGGQWQKLAIVRAFIKKSDIFIFDEPSASLDPVSEAKFYKILKQELSSNKKAIFVSHNLKRAIRADKILLLKNGTLIFDGTQQELLKSEVYKKTYVKGETAIH